VRYVARILTLEAVIMKEELTGADYLYSVKIGTLLGFIVGWFIGIAMLLYVGSQALNDWPWVGSIPLWYGLGWATYGFIIGGGGLFAHLGRATVEKPEIPVGHLTPVKPAA
jgi:hypothetical protein